MEQLVVWASSCTAPLLKLFSHVHTRTLPPSSDCFLHYVIFNNILDQKKVAKLTETSKKKKGWFECVQQMLAYMHITLKKKMVNIIFKYNKQNVTSLPSTLKSYTTRSFMTNLGGQWWQKNRALTDLLVCIWRHTLYRVYACYMLNICIELT